MTSDHKPQSDQAAGASDTSKARKGADLINQQLQDASEASRDTLQLADQAAGPSDANKVSQGVKETGRRLQGAGERTSDTLQLTDQAAGPGDTNKARKGVKEIGQQLQGNGDTTSLSDESANLVGSQQRMKDTVVDKEDPTTKSSESRDEIIQVDDSTEIRFDELKPNATYEKEGYRFYTDEQCRPARIGGFLQDKPGHRNLEQQRKVGHLGNKGDEGGHLIATRFNGPTDGFNLVPQHMNLNRGAWKTMENKWSKTLKQGGVVEVATSPVYLDNTRRPMAFDVMYRIIDQSGDNYHTKTFNNQSSKEE